jgi:uncharacterized protein YjiS (DUF1127 family)
MAYSLSSERPVAAAAPFAFVAGLLHLVGRLAKARRRRLALAMLLEMDDYRLWDLGISRADLPRVLRSDDFDADQIRYRRRDFDVSPPR